MAISVKHRNSLYSSLSPMVGEEEADVLLSQFPTREEDEPATKDFVRAEINGLRAAMHADIGGLRSELHTEVGGLRSELHTEIGGLRSELHTEIGGLRSELHTEVGGLRGEMYQMESRIGERLRQQTVWICGLLIVLTGIWTSLTFTVG